MVGVPLAATGRPSTITSAPASAAPSIICGRCQQVIGDVHPADIYYTRADGSTATAKLIAWPDVANHRLRVLPVFLEKGEGVRQEHVIQSFIEMAGDPLWACPLRSLSRQRQRIRLDRVRRGCP